MRSLRWAAEMAASDDVCKARLGIQEFKELRSSGKLTETDRDLIYPALEAALDGVRREIEQGDAKIEVLERTSLTDTQVEAAKMIRDYYGGKTPESIQRIAGAVVPASKVKRFHTMVQLMRSK